MAEHDTDHGQHNGINGLHTHSERNAWSSPGPAAFDFRSMLPPRPLSHAPQDLRIPPTKLNHTGDVVTTPTPSMLRAIANCTLLDDVFAEDPTTTSLESHIASLTNHPAALLVLSGTMGNQLCIRTHLLQPPHSLLADARSHIYEWEAGGIASLSGAFPISVRPSNGHHLTLPDIIQHAVLPSTNPTLNIHRAPTRLIVLENTLDGTILPLAAARAIAAWARAQSPPIATHCDGARLWEAVAAAGGAGSLRDYAACFDSLSLCFSKGLGAPVGSVVVGSEAFIARARHVRKALGGGVRQAGVIAAPARVAVDETFLGGKLQGSHVLAREVGGMWAGKGGVLRGQVETNMVWVDLEASGVDAEEWVRVGVEEGVKLSGGRVVVHYQVGAEGVRRLGRVMDRVLEGGREEGGREKNDAREKNGATEKNDKRKRKTIRDADAEKEEKEENPEEKRNVKRVARAIKEQGDGME
ncbi:MAG: hypothetical protein LQ345_006373 [Seirophora villosa]|nr:MAG: hypothetical protein LQ345_006373 [Seirophora villosa]